MILSLTYSTELKFRDYTFPPWSIIFGRCLNMSFILPIPIVILYVFIYYTDPRNSLKERIRLLFIADMTKREGKEQIENGTSFMMSSSTPISHV